MLLCEIRLFQGNELQDDPDKIAEVPQALITALRGELMLLDGEAFPFLTMTWFSSPHLSLLSSLHPMPRGSPAEGSPDSQPTGTQLQPIQQRSQHIPEL